MKKRGGWNRFVGGDSCGVRAFSLLFISLIFISAPFAQADLGPDNVLILVNSDSVTSQYIAKMYCEYYPAIGDDQVLELSGLPDCSGPASTAADEIITRDVYNTCIAEPVRQHLIDNNLLDQIMVIVTTAGMPYRIEDTNPAYGGVVAPASSNPTIVADHEHDIDAASVESELTCLWYGDYGANPVGLKNRIVNPYQGCRSQFDLFAREMPDANDLLWSYAWSRKSGIADPRMEGEQYGYGTVNRNFGPGHTYLVCRLDGPKNQNKSAVFAVRKMLERSKRASAMSSGVNPNQAVIVIDDAPSSPFGNVDNNRVFNLHDNSVDFWVYSGGAFVVPDAYGNRVSNDYVEAFFNLIDIAQMQYIGDLYFGTSDSIHGIPVLEDFRDYQCTAAYGFDFLSGYFPDREAIQGVIAFCCYGRNGDEGRNQEYLLNGGPGGQVLYSMVNGAVFTSIESFNALTMFFDATTTQAKIIDFIEIGGSGAIGHAFEPQEDAVIDNEFFFFNLMADESGPGGVPDDVADLTFAEAAWTGIPYLSWSEVVIGDPLMRISYGPGEAEAWEQFPGDVNRDDRVNIFDIAIVRSKNGGMLNSANPVIRDKYSDLCDLNKDGRINIFDIAIVRSLNGTMK